MAFDADWLKQRLADLASDGVPKRYLVAFSGGLDSTALLHALASLDTSAPLLAVHVQHDLHADAAHWTRHCRDTAALLGVAFECVSVKVARDSGLGIEAAARMTRYAALSSFLQKGDWLFSAHHQNDQAETLLLNLLRGSGVDGLAGIATMQTLAAGTLVRPLLDVTRGELDKYAELHGLSWLEDPSNADNQFDRNFLRNDIFPRLAGRWPAAVARLARSSALAGEASTLIATLADKDIDALGTPSRINIGQLLALDDMRQRNVLRRAMRRCKLTVAPETRLREIQASLLQAKDDAAPLVSWSGAEARRYRDTLYLQPHSETLPESDVLAGSLAGAKLTREECVDMGSAGTLRISADARICLQPALLDRGLNVRFREGGESIRPVGQAHTHKLKKLLQEEGVVPWMRKRIPLLYSDQELVAVGDLWVADGCAATTGSGVTWENRPDIF